MEINSPALIKLKLTMVQCDAIQSAPEITGNVSVENNISVQPDNDRKEYLFILLTTTIKGITESEEEAFSAKSSWEGTFFLKSGFEPEEVKKNAEFYVGKMYSQSRGFIVDTLFKMGVNVNDIPLEVNPKDN